MQIVTFTIDDQEYGIDISKISEVERLTTPVKLPNTPEYYMGIISIRGIIVPVISFRKLFKLSFLTNNPEKFMIIIKNNKNNLIGIAVDFVKRVSTIDETEIESCETIINNLGKNLPISGIYKSKKDDKLISLLDIDKLFLSNV